MGNENYSNDKLEFRQIVLSHIQVILKISSEELRDKKTYMKGVQGDIQLFSQEDTRHSYIQAIENLSYILMPYFDKEMTKLYNEYIEIINKYNFQLEKIFYKDIKAIIGEVGEERFNKNIYCLDKKVDYAKKLFVALNLLLNRNDYLKSAVYGEDKDEVIEDNDDGGDEE